MTEFKPLEIFEYPRVGAKATEDNLYWKKLGFPCAFKEYGAIDFIDFCTEEPYNVAVTCSSKVQIYSTTSNSLQSTLSRFKKTAYGGVFRKDGKLLLAGSDDNFVRLFEVKSGRLLRVFKGHKAAVHRCNFTADGTHIVSFSDDKSVALWDIPTETKLKSFEEHQDYIRAGAVSQASQDVFISGSYDHAVKMYDARSGSCVMSVDHGVPVESVLMFPTGGLFISAGGTSLKVWDPIAGRLLAQVVQHHKTITSLCFASGGRRLMSGSLDRHIKIYDVTSYEVVHTLNYSSPILSVAAAPEDKVVAVGMTDGLLSIKHRKTDKPPEEETKNKSVFYQYRLYGTDFKPADGDIIVPVKQKRLLKRYENHLRNFESSKALDVVLKDNVQAKNPEITISVLMELIRRGSVRAAMAGREGESLLQLLKFVTKYIGDPRFMRVLVDIGLILIEIYGPKFNDPEVKQRFQYLLHSVENQVQYMKEMMEVQGIIQTVLASTYSYDNNEDLVLSSGLSKSSFAFS
ncbi:U3 small nucleolar RNA-associated protein 15 homolog [Stegodyphus dumicola]|uniref:U3 small nucleolar RNA-associated protein 15 homolog n=1 Tax=Stegodyphus dumicola TaxID=202533 RepID=UPI0015A8C1EB|nr:U3 small nucleolar RNA-associated protein 15 homolog [Stegodyphus dumicola]